MMESKSDNLEKVIPFHSPLVTASVNYHGHQLLKLLIADNPSQIERINLLDIDYGVYQERMPVIKRKEDKIKELLEFIAAKCDYLMVKPKTQLFFKYADKDCEDRYKHLLPIEYLMKVPKTERLRQLMLFIEEGHILLVMVNGFIQSLYSLKFLAFDNGPHRYLYDAEALDIKIFMYPEETDVPRCDSDRYGKWLAGTRLRVVVTKIEDYRICVSTKEATGTSNNVKLGKITISDLPQIFNDIKGNSINKLSECFAQMKSFQNPQSIKNLALQMNLDLRSYPTLMPSFRQKFPEEETAPVLRKQQMCKWAHKSVAEGVQHFKTGQHDEAFQCLTKALQIDPENVEAYVAKGALLANLGRYEKAVEGFELALKFNPNHANARKYVCETLVELGKQHEENKKAQEAEKCYLKCLEINKDHQGCREALDSLLKKLKRETSLESIIKKMNEDQFYSDLVNMEKDLNAKGGLSFNEETEPNVKKPSLSPLSQKLASHSAIWTCPSVSKETIMPKQENSALEGKLNTQSSSWDSKNNLKEEFDEDHYNAMVAKFLKNISSRDESSSNANSVLEKQTSKELKKKRHRSSDSSSTKSSDDSSKKKHVKNKKSKKLEKKDKKPPKETSDSATKKKESEHLPPLDYADLEKQLNEYVQQMENMSAGTSKTQTSPLPKAKEKKGESAAKESHTKKEKKPPKKHSHKSKKRHTKKRRKSRRSSSSSSTSSSSSASSSSSSSYSSSSFSSSSSRSRSYSHSRSRSRSRSYDRRHRHKRSRRTRSRSPAYHPRGKYENPERKPYSNPKSRYPHKPYYSLPSYSSYKSHQKNNLDYHYNKNFVGKHHAPNPLVPESQIISEKFAKQDPNKLIHPKVKFTLQAKNKIINHLSSGSFKKNTKEIKKDAPQTSAEPKVETDPSKPISPSQRFGKWVTTDSKPVGSSSNLKDKLSSHSSKAIDSPKTLDQFEEFIKKGKEQIKEKMKERNKEFIKNGSSKVGAFK